MDPLPESLYFQAGLISIYHDDFTTTQCVAEYRTKVDDPTPIIVSRINTTFFNHSKYDLNRLKSSISGKSHTATKVCLAHSIELPR